MEGEVGGAKHLRRSEVGRRVLLESPIVDGTTLVGSVRVMEMVGLAVLVALVVVVVFKMDGWVEFKMDGWVEFHMEDGQPRGLLGREREPTDLKARSIPLVITRTS